MTTSIKITALNNIGSNIAPTTLVPVVDMAGVPTTEKANLQIVGNLILSGAGGANFASAAQAINAQTVSNAAQPSITSVGTLSNLAVSGNVSVNGNISSNGTAFVGNLSTTGLASITTLSVGATANLGAIGNIKITGGTAGQILSTDGAGNLSWASDATSYGNSNVAAYLPTYTGNLAGDYLVLTHDVGANIVDANYLYGDGSNITNLDVGNIASINLDGNSQTWLAGNGVFANITIPTVGNIATLNLDGNTSNVLHGDGSWSADTTTYGNSNVVTLLSSFGSNTITTTGNVSVGNIIGNGQGLTGIAGANVGGFVPNANVANTAFAVAAANVSGLGNIATINLDGNVSNLLTGNGTYVAIPTVGNIASINLDGNSQTWLAGNGAFANIAIPTVGNIASINLDGNVSNVLYGNGEFASAASVSTGNITFTGDDINSTGNIINLSASNYVQMNTGNTYIWTEANSAFIGAGAIDAWEFSDNGNLILPLGGSIYSQAAPITGNAIVLNPHGSGSTTDQKLLVYPTVADGDHLHLATGNLYQTELFLGTDDFYVKLANSGNVVIRAADNIESSAEWIFGADGNLTFPTNIIKMNFSNGAPAFGNIVSVNLDGNSQTWLAGNGVFANIAIPTVGNIATLNLDGNVSNVLRGDGTFGADANSSYGDSNVVSLLAAFGSNTISTTGNITGDYILGNGSQLTSLPVPTVAQDITSNGSMSIMTYDGNLKYVSYATVEPSTGNIAGGNISTAGNITGNTNGFTIGYLNLPQVAAANATLALSDAGKHYYSTSAGNFTLTIPNNATTSFATGTAISIVVQAAGNILANADTGVTLYMAGNSTAANRVVGSYGMATLMKVGTDTWFINGTGVS